MEPNNIRNSGYRNIMYHYIITISLTYTLMDYNIIF